MAVAHLKVGLYNGKGHRAYVYDMHEQIWNKFLSQYLKDCISCLFISMENLFLH